jgi:hypothetical protein
MKFVSRVCSKCGAEIFADAAEGLCTACLLETGLGLFSDAVDRVNDPAVPTGLGVSILLLQTGV